LRVFLKFVFDNFVFPLSGDTPNANKLMGK